MHEFAPSTEDAPHYLAIQRLQSAYADAVSRRAWPELGDLFLPHAVVRVDKRAGEPIEIVGPDALGAFIGEAITRFEHFQFVVLNARVRLRAGGDPYAATGRMFMHELRFERAAALWSDAYGVYHDRYEQHDGRWWFARRRYHSLARAGRDVEVFPFPVGVDPLEP